MKAKHLAVLLVLTFLAITCRQFDVLVPTRIRQAQPSEASGWHQPLTLQVGWFPYQEYGLERSGKNEWRVVKDEEGKLGIIPQILVHYPGSTDSLWLDMNVDDALLGRLVKHSLITQVPIHRPYSEFFEQASCLKCHPEEVKVRGVVFAGSATPGQ